MNKDRVDNSLNKGEKYKKSNSKKASSKIITERSGFFNIQMSKVKNILIVIASALLIGSMLGFMMIKMITNFEPDLNEEPLVANASLKDNDTKEANPTDLETLHLDKIHAFVLQVGVFSEVENANEWEATFKEADIKTFIWEREGKHYLLAGIAPTKDQAQIMATRIKEANFDVFIKEWETNEVEKQVTLEEEKWIKSFLGSWDKTLQSFNDQEHLESTVWDELISHFPKESTSIVSLIETLNNSAIQEINKRDEQDIQYFLLDLWYHYESIFD